MTKTLRLLLLITIFYNCQVAAQTKKVSRDWTSFIQSIEVKADTKTKFRLQGLIKVDRTDTTGVAAL